MNIITEYENVSRRVVPQDNYYIISLKLASSIFSSDITSIIKKIVVLPNVEKRAICVYFPPSKDELILLFSCVGENDKHNMNGCHHSLVSYFSSWLTLEEKSLVRGKLIELNSRTKVVEYFHSLVFGKMFDRAGRSFPTIEDAIENMGRGVWDALHLYFLLMNHY
jgi:hypothetical protein